MPEVSVVVPVYNVEEYLDRCLESIAGQTLDDIEIIAVNDGSTDSSGSILAQWTRKEPRLKVIEKPNGGLSSARNAGIDAATGTIVCFVDSDDWLELDACERIAEAFAPDGKTEVDVVTFGAHCRPASDDPWLNAVLSPADADYDGFSPDIVFKERSRPFAWRTACRVDFLREMGMRFLETLRFGEDQAFQFMIYPRSRRTKLVSDKLYDYRLGRAGSLMDTVIPDQARKLSVHIDIAAPILQDWRELGLLDSCAPQLAEWLVEFFLYEMFYMSDEDQRILNPKARDLIATYWSADDIERLDITPSSKQIMLNLLNDERLSALQTKRLRRRYYTDHYGYAGLMKQAVRRALGRG